MTDTLRTYGERCAAARALDLVGERWALLVVRELLLGPKRFTDLREGLPKAKPSVISQRLRELEAGGVVQRRRLGPPARTSVYELTESGRGLEPVIIALGRWGRLLPAAPGTAHLADALVLALRWRFDEHRSDGLEGCYEIRLGDDRFCVNVSRQQVDVRRGEPRTPDAVVEADTATLEAVLFDGMAPELAETEGRLLLSGDRPRARRLLEHYSPATAAAAGH